jgi:hypothetical protein
MARGLSDLQIKILELAYSIPKIDPLFNPNPKSGGKDIYDADWNSFICAENVINKFYPSKTLSERVIVSKSLYRLWNRGFLESPWRSHYYKTGKRQYFRISQKGIDLLANSHTTIT